MTSTSYPEHAEDWRGRFIFNLAAALGRLPSMQLSLWSPPGDLPLGVAATGTPQELAWLQHLSRQGGIAHLLRTHKPQALYSTAGLLRRLHRAYRREPMDVVHVNWLQNALPLWGTRTPAVISVLGTDFSLMRLPGMTALLGSVFRQRPTLLAPNAEWMVPELQRRFGQVARVQAVPFGIDAAWFSLQRQLPMTGPSRWMVVTRLTRSKLGDLFDWGEGLFNGTRELHLFGPMQEKISVPDWVHYHGPTHPAELQNRWFPRATGLLTLSRHDEGRPQVMLEAMAAGLPIVASDLPAHADFLQQERTGLLVGDPQALALALQQLEQAPANTAMGEAARDWARKTVGTWDDCALRFQGLYAELVGGSA